jgi:2,5-diketo-D-gluconate reductase B
MIEDAIESCDKPILANQIEHHPYLQQLEMQKYLESNKIALISYSPLGRGDALNDPIIKQIAESNKTSPAQVCLSGLISKNAMPIPKATSLEHLKDNYSAIDVQLTNEEHQQIDNITISKR